MSYDSNIKIGSLTLETNPSSYSKEPRKMGSFNRTIAGGLISQDISEKKYIFKISALTQTQITDIRKYAASEFNLSLIDYIPISERGSATRSIHEYISINTINGETIYTYVPEYLVAITDYSENYEANSVTYSIIAEEI